MSIKRTCAISRSKSDAESRSLIVIASWLSGMDRSRPEASVYRQPTYHVVIMDRASQIVSILAAGVECKQQLGWVRLPLESLDGCRPCSYGDDFIEARIIS